MDAQLTSAPCSLLQSKAIAERLVPNHAGDASSYLRPLAEQYNNISYDGMEKAIFPSYFHGTYRALPPRSH